MLPTNGNPKRQEVSPAILLRKPATFVGEDQRPPARSCTSARGVLSGQGDNALGDDLAGNSSVASVVWRKARSIMGSTNNRCCLGIAAAVVRNKLRDLSHPSALGALRDGEIF